MVDYAAAIVDGPDAVSVLDFIKESSGQLGCDNDYQLTININTAFRILEQYLDTKLVSQEITERHKVVRDQVALRYWPASNVTAITLDGDDVLADYKLFSEDGLTWISRDKYTYLCFQDFKQFDVTYTAGFDPVPLDIVYAVQQFSEQIGNTSGPGTVKKESVVGVGSIEYVTAESATGGIVPESIASIVSHYRNIHV